MGPGQKGIPMTTGAHPPNCATNAVHKNLTIGRRKVMEAVGDSSRLDEWIRKHTHKKGQFKGKGQSMKKLCPPLFALCLPISLPFSLLVHNSDHSSSVDELTSSTSPTPLTVPLP